MLDVLVFASRKGGAGKTTLAGHLAVEAVNAGRNVALIDTDGQGSLTDWWNAREAASPLFANATLSNLKADLKGLERDGVDLVLIDTRGDVTEDITAAVKIASLVLVPVRPSPHDLRAVGRTLDIIASHKRPLTFILNAAPTGARMTEDAVRSLAEYGTIARPTIHQRVIFMESMIDGRTAGELDPKCKAAGEIAELWTSIAARLERIRTGLVTV